MGKQEKNPTPSPEIKVDNLRALYGAVSSYGEADNLGDFDTFYSRMSKPENRRAFYEGFSPVIDGLGTFEQFESRLLKKKENSESSSKPAPSESDSLFTTSGSPVVNGSSELPISGPQEEPDTAGIDNFLPDTPVFEMPSAARRQAQDNKINRIRREMEASATLTPEESTAIEKAVEKNNNSSPINKIGTFFKRGLNPFSAPVINEKMDLEEELRKASLKKKQEFASGLSRADRDLMLSLSEAGAGNLQEQVVALEGELEQRGSTLEGKGNLVEDLGKRMESITGQLEEIKAITDKNGGGTKAQIEEYNNLIGTYENLDGMRKGVIKEMEDEFSLAELALDKYEESDKNLKGMQEEVDVFKRNYSRLDNFGARAAIGIAEVAGNLDYMFTRGRLRNQRKALKNIFEAGMQNEPQYQDQIPAAYKVASWEYNEDEFDAETDKMLEGVDKSFAKGKEILNREKLEKYRPQIEAAEIGGFGDVVDFVANGLADNAAVVGQLAIPVVGQPLFLTSQTQSNLLEGRSERAYAEDRIKELTDDSLGKSLSSKEQAEVLKELEALEATKNMTDSEIAMASVGKATAELIFSRLFGEAKRLKTGKRILQQAGKGELKAEVKRGVKERLKGLKDEFLKTGRGTVEEGVDEVLTGITQRTIDKFVLGKKDVNLFDADAMLEEFAGGVSVGGVMEVAPRVAGQIIGYYSTKKKRNKIYENTTRLREIEGSLSVAKEMYGENAEAKIKELQKEAATILGENRKILNMDVEAVDGMSEEAFKELNYLSEKQRALEISVAEERKEAKRLGIQELGEKNVSRMSDEIIEIENRKEELLYEKTRIDEEFNVEDSSVSQETVEFAPQELGDLYDASEVVDGAVQLESESGLTIQYKVEGDKVIVENAWVRRTSDNKDAGNTFKSFLNKATAEGKTVEIRVPDKNAESRQDFKKTYVDAFGFSKPNGTNIRRGDRLVRTPEQGSFPEQGSPQPQPQPQPQPDSAPETQTEGVIADAFEAAKEANRGVAGVVNSAVDSGLAEDVSLDNGTATIQMSRDTRAKVTQSENAEGFETNLEFNTESSPQEKKAGLEYSVEAIDEMLEDAGGTNVMSPADISRASGIPEAEVQEVLSEQGYEAQGDGTYSKNYGPIVQAQAEGVSDAESISEQEATELLSLLEKTGLQDEKSEVLSDEDIKKKMEEIGGEEMRKQDDSNDAMTKAAPKTLAAAHNINVENLMRAMEIGGLPAPSIAIVDTRNQYNAFGTISLVGDASMVDPIDSQNEVFSKDAYSPVFPNERVIYSVTLEEYNAHISKMQEQLREFGLEVTSPAMYPTFAQVKKGGGAALATSPAYRIKYLLETNQQTAENVLALMESFDGPNKMEYAVRRAWFEAVDKKTSLSATVEIASTREFQQEYDAKKQLWVSGTLGSWDAHIEDFNLQNIAALMSSQSTVRGEVDQSSASGVGALGAALADRFQSLQDIVNSKDRIVSREAFLDARRELYDARFEVVEKIKQDIEKTGWMESQGVPDWGLVPDAWFDSIMIDAYFGYTDNIDAAIGDTNVISEETLQSAVELLDAINTTPSHYFEAKIQRGVEFKEFKSAVYPKEATPQNVVDYLKEQGVELHPYSILTPDAVGILEANEVQEAARHSAFLQATQNVRFQNSASSNGITLTPHGFVHEGKVYINKDKVKADTPIHEFGHLWNDWMKENHTEHYKAGLEIVRGTEYHERIKNHPGYAHLSEEQQLEEALAQAIGDRGAKIYAQAKSKKFSSWFLDLFRKIAAGLGISGMKVEDVSKMTIEQFADLAATEILSGKELRKGKGSKADPQGEAAQRITETRNELQAKFSNPRLRPREVRAMLLKHIQDVIDNQAFNKEGKKRELMKIARLVKNTNDITKLRQAMKDVSTISTEIENRAIERKLNRVLNRKTKKKESGKTKANLTTQQEGKFLDDVKANVYGTKDINPAPFKNTPANRERVRMDELREQREVLQDKLVQEGELSEAEILQLETLNTSIGILEARLSGDAVAANALWRDALEAVTSIYDFGRSRLLELQRQERERYMSEVRDPIVKDTKKKGANRVETPREAGRKAKGLGKTGLSALDRLRHQVFGGGFFTGSLDRIATIISQKGGANRDSSPMVQFVNRLKKQERKAKATRNRLATEVKNARKKVFGSEVKALKQMQKKLTISVARNYQESDANTPAEQRKDLTLTQAEWLNVWMNSKNENLLRGLEANGFDAEAIAEIESKLSDEMKDYAIFLWEFYDSQLHPIANEMYKKLNNFELAKEPFYAGKVVREKGDTSRDDLDYGGNYGVGTVGYGSLKQRTLNNDPIAAEDVNRLVNRAIVEAAHYNAYGQVYRDFTRLLKDKWFRKNITDAYPNNGESLLTGLKRNKDYVEVGQARGSAVLDTIARNVTRSVLGGKIKILMTQMVSFTNGAIDMPDSVGIEAIKYYEPTKVIKTFRELLSESDFLKQRYDVGGVENAVFGLSELANGSEFAFNNYPTIEAKRQAASRFYKKAMDVALLNVKFGDAFGVMGAVPTYLAWLDRYKKGGMSEADAKAAALEKFEAVADRSQQTNSKFGKSGFQNHPYARYLAMFATAPIQNMNNADYHWRELMRGMTRGAEGAKGTRARNALGVLNYAIAQPAMYTYVASAFTASLLPFFYGGDDDEAANDNDKDLLQSIILGNFESVPIAGGILELATDKLLLDKDNSYGAVIESALLDSLNDMSDNLQKAMDAKSQQTKDKYVKKLRGQLITLFTGYPKLFQDVVEDYDDVYADDAVSTQAKIKLLLGWSKGAVASQGERKTQAQIREEIQKEKEKFEKNTKRNEKKSKSK